MNTSKSTRPFKKIFKENLLEIFSFKFLLLPVAISLIKSLGSTEFLVAYVSFFLDVFTWFYSVGIFLADAFLRAVYWYARERNPSYIKKQEAYEKSKAEKESKKSAQTGETES